MLLGSRLSLVCGIGLDSNPLATITWTAPSGSMIMDNARFDLENGRGIVRLNFTHTIMSDNGVWRCNVTVRSDKYVASDGNLVLEQREVIGTPLQYDIQLTVIGECSIPARPGSNIPLILPIIQELYSPISAPLFKSCLLYTSPSPRDATLSRMPSSA